MLRLLVLLVVTVGLVSLLPPTRNASALPDGISDRDCLGPLLSSIARGAAQGRTLRVDQAGEVFTFPDHFNGDFNPGDFHGASSLFGFIGFDELHIDRYGCFFAVPVLTSCIDFTGGDPCGDPDHDGYWNEQEWTAGSDPNNPQSTPEFALLDEQTGSNTCDDRVDNDLDGRIDNADSGCRLTCDDFGHSGRCADPDGDGWVNYVEGMWGSDPDDASSTPWGIGDCIDFDNGPVCAPF